MVNKVLRSAPDQIRVDIALHLTLLLLLTAAPFGQSRRNNDNHFLFVFFLRCM